MGSDAANKPSELSTNADKLSGHAVQNWCFLRLLPLIIGDRIKDAAENQVWSLCLNLRNIVNLICSPKIDIAQVAELRVAIEEYIQDRCKLFPQDKLRPKHHYLVHYPELILQFGPLIRLWTLRFESKHTYFKQCARKLHNFKNLCSTLATRHQLLQAYYSAGFLFPPTVTVDNGIEFHADSYNFDIQQAVEKWHFLPHSTVASYKVTYKGTIYKKGFLVPIDQNEEGIVFGKIVLILVNEGYRVYFVAEKCQSVYFCQMGLTALLSKSEDHHNICILADKVLDYYPLPEYKSRSLLLVPLHHAVSVSWPLD